MRKIFSIGAIAAALTVSLVAGAQAQSYPTRTIKIVVPATPGGAIDTIARLVGVDKWGTVTKEAGIQPE